MTLREYEEFREWADENLEGVFFFEGPNYATAVLGYCSETGRIIYDGEACIDFLIDHHDMKTIEDASDFFSYNTLRALTYLDPAKRPIVVMKAK